MRISGVILIIIVVILYFLWIFYTKNKKAVSAKISAGVQIFDIIVKGGYSPHVIEVKKDRPVRINFTRQESSSCGKFVVFSDFKIRKELPENQRVAVEFTPHKMGEFSFTCDMGMYQGRIIVK